MQKGIWLNNFY